MTWRRGGWGEEHVEKLMTWRLIHSEKVSLLSLHIPQPTQSLTMAPSSFRAKGWDPLLIIAQASRLIIKGG